MLFVAIELLEVFDADESAIITHQGVALFFDPLSNGFVVTFAGANEGGAEVEMLRFARGRLSDHFFEESLQLSGGQRRDGAAGFRMMLHAEAGVEEAEILSDLGNRRDRRFTRAAVRWRRWEECP